MSLASKIFVILHQLVQAGERKSPAEYSGGTQQLVYGRAEYTWSVLRPFLVRSQPQKPGTLGQ